MYQAFPDKFSGTYDESEQWVEANKYDSPPKPTFEILEKIQNLMRSLDLDEETKKKTLKVCTTQPNAEVILKELEKKISKEVLSVDVQEEEKDAEETQNSSTIKDAEEVFGQNKKKS